MGILSKMAARKSVPILQFTTVQQTDVLLGLFITQIEILPPPPKKNTEEFT
jgi:hypothetical protein